MIRIMITWCGAQTDRAINAKQQHTSWISITPDIITKDGYVTHLNKVWYQNDCKSPVFNPDLFISQWSKDFWSYSLSITDNLVVLFIQHVLSSLSSCLNSTVTILSSLCHCCMIGSFCLCSAVSFNHLMLSHFCLSNTQDEFNCNFICHYTSSVIFILKHTDAADLAGLAALHLKEL